MLAQIPNFVNLLFVLLTAVAIGWFYLAANKSQIFLIIIISWGVFTSVLAYIGFFAKTDSFPPNFALGLIPPVLMMVYLFFTQKGKAFIDQINLETLTYFNLIRVPVEFFLLALFNYKVISVYQTFEGWNFDILSGITAPIVAYLYFSRKSIGKTGLLIWNFMSLGLLLTIIIISILATPIPIQQIAFNQPNIGILYYPFNLLPHVIVQLVLFGHLVSISRLMRSDVVESIEKKKVAVV